MLRSFTLLMVALLLEWTALAGIGHPAGDPALPALPAETREDGSSGELPAYGDEEDLTILETTHERVSKVILETAQWIDSFFVDERVEGEESETRLRLGASAFIEDEEIFRTDLLTNFRLDLPVFSKRFHLLFTGDDEQDEDRILAPEGRDRRPAADLRDRKAEVALRYSFLDTLRRNLSLSTGVRFRGGSPVVLLEPRYRQNFPIHSWELRFIQRFTALSDESMEARTTFDLERPLGEKFFFRTTADADWFDDVDGYFYGLHFVLFQPIDRNRIVQYGWSNGFVTRPTHVLEVINLLISYRQRFWREWLYYEVRPQLSFPRAEDYDISPGIMLRLDMVFGRFEKLGMLF